jgi:outer membrane protein TolC
MRRRIIALASCVALSLLLSPLAQAQSAGGGEATPTQVRALLGALAGHPALRAVAALSEAAERRTAAVRAPLEIAGQLELQRRNLFIDGRSLSPAEMELLGVEQSSNRINVRLVMRPFLFGDLVDLYDQRRIDAERAALQARETRANLEAQALRAALGVWLSEYALSLAEGALQLAELAEVGTRARAAAGGASSLEVGRAELTRREAEANLRDARRNLELARAQSDLLAPGARLDGPFALLPVIGTAPEVIRAGLDTALAEVGERNARRALWPTVQGNLSWRYPDGETLTLALESRTLQPALIYDSGSGASAAMPGGAPPTIRNFGISISWTLALQTLGEGGAARVQGEAARSNLEGAIDRADLTEWSLSTALEGAELRLELAELDLSLATLERDTADLRFASGSISELERLQAHLQWRSSAFAHARARLDRLSAILDTYTSYAIPLSEVLP